MFYPIIAYKSFDKIYHLKALEKVLFYFSSSSLDPTFCSSASSKSVITLITVSYTHLDVYKRQAFILCSSSPEILPAKL